jgi:hypothetical protein
VQLWRGELTVNVTRSPKTVTVDGDAAHTLGVPPPNVCRF